MRLLANAEAGENLAEQIVRHDFTGELGERELRMTQLLGSELGLRQECRSSPKVLAAAGQRLHVPLPVEEATSRRVLTMDDIPGRKITDLTPVGRTDVDGAILAGQLVRAYLDQVLVEGFFHADPHPGNVLLTDDHDLVLLDLGMVARVPDRFRDALIRLLVAIGTDDGEEAARVTVGLGTTLSDFDEPAFVRAVAAVARAAESGVRIGCFRPPSTPDGISRLRLTAHAQLTDDELAHATSVIEGLVG